MCTLSAQGVENLKDSVSSEDCSLEVQTVWNFEAMRVAKQELESTERFHTLQLPQLCEREFSKSKLTRVKTGVKRGLS